MEKRIRDLIASTVDDGALLRELTALAAQDWEFGRHVASWGPELYERNRELFLPLIERHAGPWALRGAKNLATWMAAADANDDARLYRSLFEASLLEKGDWAKAGKAWVTALKSAFRDAPDRAARRGVLERCDLRFELSDDDALELYRVDPRLTAEFVLKRLSRERWYDVVYEKTAEAARREGDEEFYFELYRLTFPREIWRKDAVRLCNEIADPERLVEELELRDLSHPEGGLVAADFTLLATRRGRDVAPYLRVAIPRVWSWDHEPWAALLDIVLEGEWFDIFGVIARTQLSARQVNELVIDLATNSELPEPRLLAWLMQLVGAQTGFREWRRTITLNTEAARKLYARFPELLRGPFAPHLVVGIREDLAELAQEAEARGDLELVDQLAASAIGASSPHYYGGTDNPLPDKWWYVEYYSALSEQEFAERALRVVGQVAPFPHLERRFLRTKNPLYSLFLRRPEAYLPVREHVRDLLEAPNVEVRTLGLRLLFVRRDDVARRLAVNNVDHLLPYLLDEAPRRTRIAAFEALALAASSSLEMARHIESHARATLDLRRRDYPRDRLIELVGTVIGAWPELRRPTEQPVVYEVRP